MPMTEDERYEFDVAGFLVRSAILTPDEVAMLREHVDRLLHQPDAVPAEERAAIGGPGAMLIDHPHVTDVLHEVIGPQLRLEGSFAIWRRAGEAANQGLHQGGWDQADPVFGYRVSHDRIYAGMVRVVFELTDVRAGDGATSFLIGSHKASFRAPAGHLSLEEGKRSRLYTSYECPAGSAVFFTENLMHVGSTWRGAEPRVAVLNAYNNVVVNWHRPSISPTVLDALPPERRAWFREPWMLDFTAQGVQLNTADRFVRSGGSVYRSPR